MANRILGMGDIVSLVEEAHKAVDQQAAQDLADKLKAGNRFDLNDFAAAARPDERRWAGCRRCSTSCPPQFQQAAGRRRHGQGRAADLRRMQGIIQSMTTGRARQARADQGEPQAAHRQPVPACQVQEVNRLLSQFDQMQSMMKKMQKGGLAKMMRGMKGMMPGMR